MLLLIDPADTILILFEIIIAVLLMVTCIVAIKLQKQHSKLASKGWPAIVNGLVLILIHAIFDVLDTLDYSDLLADDTLLVDLLNVGDGLSLVVGIGLLAYGIYVIAEYGAEIWERA